MNPGVQIPKVRLQIQPVVPPRDPIDPRGRVRADRPVRLPQTIDAHVMKERGEPHIPVLPRHLAHTIQITGHALSGTASGTCFTGRVPLGQAPSLHHLRPRITRACSAASQVLRACLTSRDRASRDYRLSVPLTAHQTPTCHPANHPGRGINNDPRATTGSPGSRAWSSSCVPGFFDRAGPLSDSR